jgi:hypothetical protein
MASRKKGTGQPLLEHEKLAIVSVKMKRGYKYQNGSQLRQWVNENVPLTVPKVCMLELLQGSCQVVLCFLVQK